MSGKVNFLISAFRREQWPVDVMPEVAFVGRSNVGKSSCLNTLVSRRGVARVSKTPGRTQSINFFELSRRGKDLRFADLPGYGFAKVPMAVKRTWEAMVGDYLANRENLALVVVLVDIRRDPTDLDLAMVQWLEETGRPGLLVLTKSDKLSRNQRMTQQAAIVRGLGVQREATMLFSSLNGDGKDELWERIMEASYPRPEPV